ncbi:MAG: hypothetical protein MUC83_19170 [Pirellula sp.]|nr:hypothetical protein [Pirellula sp.]
MTSKRATIAYNALGQRTTLARFQSTGTTNAVATTDYTYDTINRLSSLTHKQGSTTLAGYTYAYDALSRPTSINSVVDGVSTFTYDATNQLTAADHSSQVDEAYGFDANGNRNTSGYTTATNNRATAAPGFTFTYDDEGNRTSKTETATGKVTEYTWDYRNRLTTVRDRNTSGGAVVKQVDYQYDAFNRLVRRTFDADGAGSVIATNQYLVYDEGINAVLQFDGSAASNVSHRYLWSDSVDELIANEQIGSDTLYGLGDHLGTIRDIANLNEGTGVTSVTNHRKYDSFGKLVSESNSSVDLIFGFTGKQLDETTGLQHNLFRWYDSALGQWLSEDPIGFAAGDENIRRYVGNKSISATDPSGLKVYWAARDLDGIPIGNHGFLLFIPDSPRNFSSSVQLIDLYGGNRGCTIGGYKGASTDGDKDPGKLVVRFDWKADIAAVREHFDSNAYRSSPDRYKTGWSVVLHEVDPPTGVCDTEFITALIQSARRYQANQANAPDYVLSGPNCQSWSYSILLSLGVPERDLLTAGEFPGVDWGEEESIDLDLFRAPRFPGRVNP